VSWRIYDVRGVLVRTIERGWLDEGLHERRWNGRDESGRIVASGVYFNVFRSPVLSAEQKLLLLK
jgi:flagellar hook assembly protein FlgD